MSYRGPERRKPGRGRGDRLWTWADQERFEDGLRTELRSLGDQLDHLTGRVTFMLGAVAVIAVVVPPVIVALLVHGLGL